MTAVTELTPRYVFYWSEVRITRKPKWFVESNLDAIETSPISATFDDFYCTDIVSVLEMAGRYGHSWQQAFQQSFTGFDTHCGINIGSVAPLGFGELRG